MAAVQAFGSTSSSRTYVMFLVNVMLVVSLQTFIGNSGIVSFGHVAFMGIGAYTTALVTILSSVKAAQLPEIPSFLANANFGLPAAVVVSALAAFVVAAIFGGAIIRMTEATMAMATLALLVVVHTFFQNATTYTRGALGLAGIPVRTTIGVATVAAIAFVLLSRLYKESGPGLRLRATREDPPVGGFGGDERGAHPIRRVAAERRDDGRRRVAVGPERDRLQREPVLLRDHLRATGDASDRRPDIGDRCGGGRGDHHVPHRHAARVEQGVAIGPWELPKITGTVQFVIAFLIIITLILRPEGIFDRWEIDDLVRRFLPSTRRDRDAHRRAGGAGNARGRGSRGRAHRRLGAAGARRRQVAKHFEGVEALAGVDIEVRPGRDPRV